MTKEETLNKYFVLDALHSSTRASLSNALDEWAKQEAIEFAVFSAEYEYLTWGGGKGSGWHKDRNYDVAPLSTDELYNLFQQSKQKVKP